ARDVVAFTTDDRRHFDLMVHAPVDLRQFDAFASADHRSIRLQEQAVVIDGLDIGAKIYRLISARLISVLQVVHWRGDYLAGVGDRAKQRDLGEGQRRTARGDLLGTAADRVEMPNQRIAIGQRPTIGRQKVERRRDIDYSIATYQSKAVVVEAADTHF